MKGFQRFGTFLFVSFLCGFDAADASCENTTLIVKVEETTTAYDNTSSTANSNFMSRTTELCDAIMANLTGYQNTQLDCNYDSLFLGNNNKFGFNFTIKYEEASKTNGSTNATAVEEFLLTEPDVVSVSVMIYVDDECLPATQGTAGAPVTRATESITNAQSTAAGTAGTPVTRVTESITNAQSTAAGTAGTPVTRVTESITNAQSTAAAVAETTEAAEPPEDPCENTTLIVKVEANQTYSNTTARYDEVTTIFISRTSELCLELMANFTSFKNMQLVCNYTSIFDIRKTTFGFNFTIVYKEALLTNGPVNTTAVEEFLVNECDIIIVSVTKQMIHECMATTQVTTEKIAETTAEDASTLQQLNICALGIVVLKMLMSW